MNEMVKAFTRGAGMSTGPVSMEPYRSPEYYALERERVFRRAWLVIGRIEDLPAPRSYIVRSVEICKASVLVTRTKSGAIKAFHNVCSHRGNQVVTSESGSAPLLVCRYHAWSYDHDGALRGVPDETSFFDFDKQSCGLTPIACEVWNGFIFINLEREPQVTLKEFLGEFGDRLDVIDYPNTLTPIVFEAHLKCNWKILQDAFSEAYHVAAIHPKTIGPTFVSKSNPFGHPVDMGFFGPHHYSSMWANPDYRTAPADLVEKLTTAHIKTGNVLAAAGLEEMERFLAHPAVNPSRSPTWANDINVVFPNFHIDTSPGGFWTHQFWPTSVGTVRWEARWYVPEAKTARERFQQEHYMARLGDTLLEDLSNLENAQVGIESGGKDFMILQDSEAMIRHSLETLDKWIASDTVAEALS